MIWEALPSGGFLVGVFAGGLILSCFSRLVVHALGLTEPEGR